jgi:hypothetical protein
MRCGIFYYSRGRIEGGQPIALPEGGVAWIRVEELQGRDLSEVLDMAQPRQGEVVMNTHILPSHGRRAVAARRKRAAIVSPAETA